MTLEEIESAFATARAAIEADRARDAAAYGELLVILARARDEAAAGRNAGPSLDAAAEHEFDLLLNCEVTAGFGNAIGYETADDEPHEFVKLPSPRVTEAP